MPDYHRRIELRFDQFYSPIDCRLIGAVHNETADGTNLSLYRIRVKAIQLDQPVKYFALEVQIGTWRIAPLAFLLRFFCFVSCFLDTLSNTIQLINISCFHTEDCSLQTHSLGSGLSHPHELIQLLLRQPSVADDEKVFRVKIRGGIQYIIDVLLLVHVHMLDCLTIVRPVDKHAADCHRY